MKHSRLSSLERHNIDLMAVLKEQTNLIFEPDDITNKLLRHLETLPDVLAQSYSEMEPCRLVVFLIKAANISGSATAALRIAGETRERALPRLLLLSTVRKILNQGMKLIGIKPLSRM